MRKILALLFVVVSITWFVLGVLWMHQKIHWQNKPIEFITEHRDGPNMQAAEKEALK